MKVIQEFGREGLFALKKCPDFLELAHDVVFRAIEFITLLVEHMKLGQYPFHCCGFWIFAVMDEVRA